MKRQTWPNAARTPSGTQAGGTPEGNVQLRGLRSRQPPPKRAGFFCSRLGREAALAARRGRTLPAGGRCPDPAPSRFDSGLTGRAGAREACPAPPTYPPSLWASALRKAPCMRATRPIHAPGGAPGGCRGRKRLPGWVAAPRACLGCGGSGLGPRRPLGFARGDPPHAPMRRAILWAHGPSPGPAFRLHSRLAPPPPALPPSSFCRRSPPRHQPPSPPARPAMAAAALSSSSSSLQRCSLARCAPRGPSRPQSPSPTSPCRLPARHPPHMTLTSTFARPPRPAAAPRRPAGLRPPARRWQSVPTRPSSRPRWACGGVQLAVVPLAHCPSDNAPLCTTSEAGRPRSRPLTLIPLPHHRDYPPPCRA